MYELAKYNAGFQAICNRICDTWNALPHTVVEAPSLNTFKRLLNNVAVCHEALLLVVVYNNLLVTLVTQKIVVDRPL